METNNKVPMRKSLHMLIRAWKIWGVLCPGVFVSQFFRAVVKAASPYVTIWLSAQLINELAGRRSPDALFFLVLPHFGNAGTVATNRSTANPLGQLPKRPGQTGG